MSTSPSVPCPNQVPKRTAPHSRAFGASGSRTLTILTWLAAAGSLAVLNGLLLYLRGHDSNHTGFEPWLFSACFVPTLVVGIVAFVRGGSRWSALFALFVGLGGMAFLFYIDHWNVLVQYDRLAARGGL